nr:MAG TPA: hypothetical protein [Caudoviricetes sp.]
MTARAGVPRIVRVRPLGRPSTPSSVPPRVARFWVA